MLKSKFGIACAKEKGLHRIIAESLALYGAGAGIMKPANKGLKHLFI
jgi:hypothetical protein